MGVKVTVNLQSLNRKLSSSNLRIARLAMANDAQQAMEKYVPKKEGHLRDSGHVVDGSVWYETPYAKAQFYGIVNGYRVHNYTTPGTSRRWDLRIKGNQQDMLKVREAFIKALNLNEQ